jgi:hypothetical protein
MRISQVSMNDMLAGNIENQDIFARVKNEFVSRKPSGPGRSGTMQCQGWPD